MTRYAKSFDRLWEEIRLYLQITDLIAEDDSFWKEYCAWKRLTETKARILAK